MGRAIEMRRFRFTVRSLMIAVAVCALLLVPVIWVAQQTALVRAERMRAIDAERRARAEAARRSTSPRYVPLKPNLSLRRRTRLNLPRRGRPPGIGAGCGPPSG